MSLKDLSASERDTVVCCMQAILDDSYRPNHSGMISSAAFRTRLGIKQDEFAVNLRNATDRVLSRAREFVADPLPDDVLYLVRPNCSYDGNPLTGDQEVFPEDSLPLGQLHLPPTDVAGAVDFLWRHGKVPEWIDMTVEKADAEFSYVYLKCCGRFTAISIGYAILGYPPFKPQGVTAPREWSLERWAIERASRQQVRAGGNPIPVPTWEDMVAKHGKFHLGAHYENLLAFTAEKKHEASK